MKISKAFLSLWAGMILAGALDSCRDLSVVNENAPDRERVLADPQNVESIIGNSFLRYWQSVHQYYPALTISTLADELSSSWCHGTYYLSSEPRVAWDNDPAFRYKGLTERPWYLAYDAITMAIDGSKRIENGMRIIDNEGVDQTIRAKAFAKFVMGLAYGHLGCFFDQAFILDESHDLESGDINLESYLDVVAFAISLLEETIALCEMNVFVLPETWINGLALDEKELQRLAHSYAARYLASVGRSSAEREAADWEKIKYHADRGITQDFAPIGDGQFWWQGTHYLGQNALWTRADYKTIGWADTSGAHDAWLAAPLSERNWYLIHTDDRRITGGHPEKDGTDFAYAGQPSFRPHRGIYHFSGYVHKRYRDHYLNQGIGAMVCFMVAELNLLKAEFYLRQGDAVSAAVEINKTRVSRGGLKPAAAIDGIGTVYDQRDPRGSLWAQMKYEKGVECFVGQALVAFYDRRGWEELVTNTPIHFPIPGRDLEILMMDNYTFGGGGAGSAPKSQNSPSPLYEPDCF
ncbi:MAG: hypothetical protein ACE5HS_10700 [bacterium]